MKELSAKEREILENYKDRYTHIERVGKYIYLSRYDQYGRSDQYWIDEDNFLWLEGNEYRIDSLL